MADEDPKTSGAGDSLKKEEDAPKKPRRRRRRRKSALSRKATSAASISSTKKVKSSRARKTQKSKSPKEDIARTADLDGTMKEAAEALAKPKTLADEMGREPMEVSQAPSDLGDSFADYVSPFGSKSGEESKLELKSESKLKPEPKLEPKPKPKPKPTAEFKPSPSPFADSSSEPPAKPVETFEPKSVPEPPSIPPPSPFDMAAPEPQTSKPAEEYVSPFGSPSESKPEPKPSMSEPVSPSSPFDAGGGELQSPSPQNQAPVSPFGPAPESVSEPELPMPEPVSVTPESTPITPEPEPPMPEPEISKESEALEGELVGEESVGGTISEEGNLQDLAVEGSLRKRLEQLLHEANLTTRHLKFCCSGVVVIILIILVAAFLVPRILSGDLFSGGDERSEVVDEVQDEVEEDVEEETSEPPAPRPVDSDVGTAWVDPSIYAGILSGNPSAELQGDTGVDTGVIVGEEDPIDDGEVSSLFQDYLANLEDLYNLYNVDVNSLLDNSLSRIETLDDHIDEMKDMYNEGVDNYEAVQVIADNFAEPFNELSPKKVALESQFFDDVAEFRGASAEENLLEFIEVSQEMTDLKAKFLAFGKLEELYEIMLPALREKLEAIELNREALISGVQVVDVEGYDLDLIVTESELGQ